LFNNYPNNFNIPTQGGHFNLVRSHSEVISLKKAVSEPPQKGWPAHK